MGKTFYRDWATEQAERTARAVAIAGKYGVERVQPGMWCCVHPDEPERSYLVTLTSSGAECTCPDFVCRTNQHNVACKHIEMMRIVFPDEAWLKRLAAPTRNEGFELTIIPKGVDPFDRK